MSLRRTYRLVCDECGTVHGNPHEAGYSTPSRARAAAKAVGWSRRKVVFISYYWRNGERHSCDDSRGRDFCEKCTEKYVAEGEES